jgi:phosphate:Na+ symporter
LLGVLLLAPFARGFAALIVRVLPERGPVLTRYLDASVARVPSVALEAARRTVLEVAANLTGVLREALERPERRRLPQQVLTAADGALRETRRFLAGVPASEVEAERARHTSLLHAIDHLDRLGERLQVDTPQRPVHEAAFAGLRARAATELEPAVHWLSTEAGPAPVALVEALADAAAARRREDRQHVLEETAAGRIDPDAADEQLEAMRWLDSALYHVWRALHHLATPQVVAQAEEEA